VGLGATMTRRELLASIAGGAVMWAAPVLAQPAGQLRRIGILHDYQAEDPEGRAQISAFRDALSKLGWMEGRNVVIDFKSGAVEAEDLRPIVSELLAKKPDVVIGAGGTIVAALQRASRSVPIVFVNVTDPVGGGLVASLAHPGGNATGFTQFEFGISAKWLELLKETAPAIMRVAVVRDPAARSGGGQLGAIQAVAPALGVDIRPIDPSEADAIEHDLVQFAQEPGGGLIVTSSRLARVHRDLILRLAAQCRLPAIYAFRLYAVAGGLMAYGPDALAPYRSAAGYVDRILKGENPADLPVQAPTKYELVINLKTAKALGLDVPPSLSARADEVIA
jgi:putative tryptophan/tyrosine transport system substrate-binding protein